MEYLTLGAVPYEESCAQVGQEDYPTRSKAECRAFLHQLERQFPVPDEVNAYLTVKSFPHDFGTYREVVVKYDPDDQAAVDYAFLVEGSTPPIWDEQALFELAEAGFSLYGGDHGNV